jgi:hypothetical protein
MNFLMEYEHLSALSPGPGQYFPRKHYPHHRLRGVKENPRKYGYYTKGPGAPKKAVKLKPLGKDQFLHPEKLTYDTFQKIEAKHKSKGADGIQHWGFKKRFPYDALVPKKGEKVKMDTAPTGGKKKGKTFKPGPGAYNIHSTWNLSDNNKTQDI